MRLFSIALSACLMAGPALARPEAHADSDPRATMHGIETVQAPAGDYVFFSSAGLPPTAPEAQGEWTHDIFVAEWNKSGPLKPRAFITNDKAQEPVSAARSEDGHIMLTFEDAADMGDEEVSQRYGVYDADLRPIADYPRLVENGAHSGHVAAVGNRFVVFYSDGWIDGGGVDNLGSGNGVYVKVYDSNGKQINDADIAHENREWWPMLAGSPTRALLLWQQYVEGQTYAHLKVALLDPESADVTGTRILEPRVRYYTYRTDYVAAVGAFLVTGTTVEGKGFAYLIDMEGKVAARLACMPATVREAGALVIGSKAYLPTADGRLMQLSLSAHAIRLQSTLPSHITWGETGITGLMRDATHLHFVSLSATGLAEADFDLADAVPAAAAEQCK